MSFVYVVMKDSKYVTPSGRLTATPFSFLGEKEAEQVAQKVGGSILCCNGKESESDSLNDFFNKRGSN